MLLTTELLPDRETNLRGQHLQAFSGPWLGTPHALWGEGTREWLLMGEGRPVLCTVRSHSSWPSAHRAIETEKPRDHSTMWIQKPDTFPGKAFQQTSQRSSVRACPKPRFPNQEASATSNFFSKDAALFTWNRLIKGKTWKYSSPPLSYHRKEPVIQTNWGKEMLFLDSFSSTQPLTGKVLPGPLGGTFSLYVPCSIFICSQSVSLYRPRIPKRWLPTRLWARSLHSQLPSRHLSSSARPWSKRPATQHPLAVTLPTSDTPPPNQTPRPLQFLSPLSSDTNSDLSTLQNKQFL